MSEIKLLPNQLLALKDTSKYKLISGGVGGGKTRLGTIYALLNVSKYPDALGCIVANTYGQLAKSTLKPFCELLNSMRIRWSYGIKPLGWCPNHQFVDWRNIFSIANGACIICSSAEREEIILGQQLAWVWMDEIRDSSRLMWSNLNSRLRDKNGPLTMMLTTTPAGRQHWAYQVFFENPIPNYSNFCLRTRDNHYLPENYANNVEAVVGKTMAAQELEGMWINATNSACFEFDRLKHVKEVSLSKDLPLILSADQNVNPMAATIIQFNKGKREVVVIDEIWIENNATTQKISQEFISRYAAWEGDVQFYCDATSNKRNTLGSPNDIEIMRQTLKSRFPSVRNGSDGRIRRQFDGIIAVNALLNPLIGEPRLKISPKCKYLIRDLEGLQWKPGTQSIDKGKPGTQSIDKENNPLLSHSSDTLRYVIAQNFPVMGDAISGFDQQPGD